MITAKQKAFCVTEFCKSESTTTVQRFFRTKFGISPPGRKDILRWYRQFVETGCLCKGKSPGRPRVMEESVGLIQSAFLGSPRKSTRRASHELQVPQSTVWKVLRKGLNMKPYKLQHLQALSSGDKEQRLEFCGFILEQTELDESFISRLVFSDEAVFHLTGKVNKHNVRIWSTENPHESVELVRDSPKLNVFCAITQSTVFGPFFFEDSTVTGASYLEMLAHWLIPQLEEQAGNFIFQQDGAPPHWHLSVRRYLNDNYPHRWIGRHSSADKAPHRWPPRSPDLTPCDFFLWGHVKNSVYVPHVPTNLEELRSRITASIRSVTSEMLQNVWREFDYRLDVVRAAQGGHIEHL